MAEKNEVATQGIASFLASPKVHENIKNVIGEENVNDFTAGLVACVQNNNTLSTCTNKSLFSGALVAKSVNLPLTPQLGYAYLVPFTSKKEIDGKKQYVTEAQLQIGYKGYIQLALRSNNFRKLIASDVRKGEISEYNPFEDSYTLNPIPFEERTAKDGKGNYIIPIIGYYAKMELMNGFIKEMYMSREDMLAYAMKYSKAYRGDLDKHTSYSFWTTKFEDMAKKTMIRQLLGKWGLLTPDLQKAYTSDMAVIDENGNPEYLDNKPDESEPTVNPMADVIDGEYQEIITDEVPDTFK